MIPWLPQLTVRILIHLLVLRPLLKLAFGVGAEGRENLSGLERFILVANHNSHLDVLLLLCLLTPRQLGRTHPVAAYEYFCKPKALLWLVTYLLQPVWVERGDRRADPLQGMREVLQRGHCLVVFPEGTRGVAGQIVPFKAGVGQLAVEFPDIPIVPACLLGPERSLPKRSVLPVPLWNRVIVGPPQLLQGTRREIAAALEGMIRELAASQAATRHKRGRRRQPVPTIAVLGIDGSGKSPLAEGLATRLSRSARVCLISDEVAFLDGGARLPVQVLLKERLREQVGRRAKTAGTLKSYRIPKLAELLLRDRVVKDIRRLYAPDLIVLDGAPLLNITAWAGLYHEEAFDEELCAAALRVLSGNDSLVAEGHAIYALFPELVTLKRLHLADLELPTATLFLDVDPRVSIQRILTRGQSRQVHETEEKLARLREGYRLVCRVVAADLGAPTRALDGHRSREEVLDTAVLEITGMDMGRQSGEVM
ncbi:MAG: 1-acyl-sn-glycerol-3-phosphate acyltransferase [bacterium]|nr:1-acyl-sn-glycerol-3-phosphate acyltransferase [bacterium]